ncbi:MAG: hypothetical protein LBC82_00980 [Oscillospiraceae bacterium]|nr:hypothetical protein [Oscillospiraceae bacterium]
MRRILLIFLSLIALIAISACADTNISQEQKGEIVAHDPDKMPEPFPLTQGGNPYLAPFFLPTDNSYGGNNSLNDVPYDLFVSKDDFYVWIESYGFEYLRTPQTSLLDYPNFFTFILGFDIPAEELRRILEEQQHLGMELNSQFYTNEEIDIICSLDESRIAEYFVSDYSIIIGTRIYPPAWIYERSIEDYIIAGITPEMVEERLELFSEFSLSAVALEAFEEKLSEFIGSDVSLSINSRSES